MNFGKLKINGFFFLLVVICERDCRALRFYNILNNVIDERAV